MLGLLQRVLFAGKENRRRRLGLQRTLTIVDVLERRELLSATSILPFSDATLSSTAPAASISLDDHFDDPDISGATVQVTTPLGSFYIETYDTITPNTAANFLSLIDGENYADMFFHRSSNNFVVQGGGFTYAEGATQVSNVGHNGTIDNEYDNWFSPNPGGLASGDPLNLRGTIAMAKVGGNPDSATSQWFVNLKDNSTILDGQNGGFTVFAQVLFDGMDTVDVIAALPTVNAGGAFSELPVRDYTSGAVDRDNLVTSVTQRVDELSYEIASNSNSQVVAATITNGHLQLAATDGMSGTAVVTVHATDLQGNRVTQSVNVTVGVPTAPVLGPPVTDTGELRPVFSWNSVPEADSYELWVSRIGGTGVTINQKNINGVTFIPDADLQVGAYRAWVRAVNGAGASTWSDAVRFVVGVTEPEAITLTGPDQASATARPEISWTAGHGVDTYDLWVSSVSTQTAVIRERTLTTNSFTPSADLPNGEYRVWVRAANVAGAGPWSDVLTFRVGADTTPLFVSPVGTTSDVRPDISWTSENDSGTFELWVNQVGGTTRIIHEQELTEKSFRPEADLPAGNYRAWVRDVSVNGNWTDAFSFTVSTTEIPGAVQVADVQPSSRPTFVWDQEQSAVRYELWVNQLGGQARIIHETDLTTTQFTATADLSDGNHIVWVRAFNADNVAGPWSDAVRFTTAPPVVPDVVTGVIVDSSGTSRPVFSWGSTTNAARYELWVNHVGGETRVIHETSLETLQYSAVDDLAAGTYRFWIRAFSSTNVPGTWTTAQQFVIS